MTTPPACRGSSRATCGRLRVGSRYVGGVFIEGAVITFDVTASRSGLTLHGVADHRLLVPAGRATVNVAVRPCDGNCSHLDPPLRCTSALDISARELTRATIVISDRGRRCRIVSKPPGDLR
jgi:hypothetical protein